MKRTATAIWSGDLKEGKGELSTQSGLIKNVPYSYVTRFEEQTGTNPEELIAAAHAGCFTMALSAFLGKAGFIAKELRTQATVLMEQEEGSWSIHAVHLELRAHIPGIVIQTFEEIAANAKKHCPISRLLNAKITLDAKLEKS